MRNTQATSCGHLWVSGSHSDTNIQSIYQIYTAIRLALFRVQSPFCVRIAVLGGGDDGHICHIVPRHLRVPVSHYRTWNTSHHM
jgi:6-phosphogluconolactonase/glucosamine-6-phosphate isomerase/deaminase